MREWALCAECDCHIPPKGAWATVTLNYGESTYLLCDSDCLAIWAARRMPPQSAERVILLARVSWGIFEDEWGPFDGGVSP